MLSNQKPSSDKLGLGFNSFEAPSSGTKEIKFVKAQKKAYSDGGYSQNSTAQLSQTNTLEIENHLNVTFDETPPPSKTSSLVDDDLDEEEAIKVTEKKNLENNIVDETLEIDEIFNIKESRSHPLENVIGNLNQRTLSFTRIRQLTHHGTGVDPNVKDKSENVTKKESIDEECSTSGSEDEEYAMAVRDFKKFLKKRCSAMMNVSLLENWPNHRTIRTKELLSEALGAIEVEEDDEKSQSETCLVVCMHQVRLCSDPSYVSDVNSSILMISL
ncbi:hypothetical protein Tco_1407688 [Tanacetum coccineum]